MSYERAGVLLSRLPTRIDLGLSDSEITAVEERFGFRFADDHRVFLQAGLPVGRGWPDWRNGDPKDLQGRLDWPREGVLFDVGHGFWYRGWGVRPQDRQEALAVADARLREAPQLVPVFSHRYLPGIAGVTGLPVLSVYQSDIICYGNDLTDYLHHEFGGPAHDSPCARLHVPFWSHFLNSSDVTAEDLAGTPVDPYATDAEEAVEHLRMLAIEQHLRRDVGADQLVQAALTAVVLGVDSPGLRALADLTRRDRAQAFELFARVVAELDLVIPGQQAEARWALVRWWLRLIVGGSLNAYRGGLLIWHEGWDLLGRPDALQPLIGWTSEYEGWTDAWGMPRETFTERIITEARSLLDGPWPPTNGTNENA